MKKILVLKWLLVIFTLAVALGPLPIHAGDPYRRPASWKTPDALEPILQQITVLVDSTLPAPWLAREPEYTWGRSNTLHWNSDSIQMALDSVSSDWTIQFFEIQARSDSTGEMWGYVEFGTDSATFTELPSGIPIDYTLRYLARHATGVFGRSVWSGSERSIQDVSRPLLDAVEIQNLIDSAGKRWVKEQNITLHIMAHDPDNGKVMQLAIADSNKVKQDTLYHDLDVPSQSIDMNIPYSFSTPENIKTYLRVWVVDVAGQMSAVHKDSLFWWEENRTVCFPNPFNPEREICTIVVDGQDITMAQIFDPFGNVICTLTKPADITHFEWDGKNLNNQVVSSGGYVFVAKGNHHVYGKIAVVR
jgi:hypothetical protein